MVACLGKLRQAVGRAASLAASREEEEKEESLFGFPIPYHPSPCLPLTCLTGREEEGGLRRGGLGRQLLLSLCTEKKTCTAVVTACDYLPGTENDRGEEGKAEGGGREGRAACLPSPYSLPYLLSPWRQRTTLPCLFFSPPAFSSFLFYYLPAA